ncbi:MAG: PP2C family protein-serine/threonine phosphatase [Planctomycetaceae bacterium]|nr:PP2C family protein-serine/threonine phosphatase [Planctomycetaceae bacterium]
MESPKSAPRWFFIAVMAAMAIPIGMSVAGRFGWLTAAPNTISPGELDRTVRSLQGLFIHTVLQWTGVCCALLTAACAMAHHALRRNLATSIVGAALLFAGCMDAFQTLAATRIIGSVVDDGQFVPFTWSLSRIFHAGVVAIGAAPFALGRPVGQQIGSLKLGFLAAAMLVGVGATYVLIRFCGQLSPLPVAIAPGAVIVRPWDAVALMIYLMAGGILLPRLYRRHPSVFAYGLMVSLVPHILGEMYATFAARGEFGVAFVTAQGLKLVGYAVPLAGLLIDYGRVYRAEGEFVATREKLRVARELQVGLLPQHPPEIAGYDIAGISAATDAVGGDWFDYFRLANGDWAIVIGDVSGHELGSALVMAQTRASLRATAVATADPGVLLTRVNEFVTRDVRDRRFVSLFIAAIHPERREIHYAAAGLTATIVNPRGMVRELPATAPVLGVQVGSIPCGESFVLELGDCLFLATDGWEESRSPGGELFGPKRLNEATSQVSHRGANDLLVDLRQYLDTYRGGAAAEDDLTAVVVKRTDT